MRGKEKAERMEKQTGRGGEGVQIADPRAVLHVMSGSLCLVSSNCNLFQTAQIEKKTGNRMQKVRKLFFGFCFLLPEQPPKTNAMS